MTSVTDVTDVRLLSLGEVADPWRDLCRRVGAAPFHWPDWYRRWSSAFTNHPLTIAAAHRHGRLIGVLPLVRRRGSLRSPVNGHTPFFGPVVSDDTALAVLLGGVAGFSRTGLVLQRLPMTPHQRANLDRSIAVGLPHRRIEVESFSRATYVTGTWEDFLLSRSRARRREIRRAGPRARRHGVVDVEIHRDRAGLAMLDACLEVGTSGWKGREGTAIVTLPATYRFYRQLAGWAAERGWLRLTALRIDDELAAFSLDLQHDGVLYLLKTGYAEHLAPAGPGTVLTHALLRDAFEDDDLKRVEWLGDDDLKRALGTDAFPLHQVAACPAGVGGYLRHVAFGLADRGGHWTRRSLPPGIHARLRALRGRLEARNRHREGADV